MSQPVNMPFLVVHPTGNTYVRNDLQALHEAGRLREYLTGFGFSRDGSLAQLPGPASLRQEFERRAYDLPGQLIRVGPMREITRLLASRLGIESLTRHETGWASVDAVFQDLDRAGAREIERLSSGPGAVLAYEDGAESTFAAAKAAGWRSYYHLPIAYGPFARKIFADEAARLPEWAATLQGDRDSSEKMARKERELELADEIICPSQFVIDSLPTKIRESKPCHLVPYGAPPPPPLPNSDPRDENPNRPLRLLFSGAVSQRKGLADVFAALRLLSCPRDIELVLLGRMNAPEEFYRAQGVPFTYESPRSNEAVLEMMSTCDALVLPSLVEGRAIVQLEALSRGLPLLVTPNAGGEDLITSGETGWLVPIRTPAALAEKMAWLLAHRRDMPKMRAACRARAEQVSWAAYRQRLLGALANPA